MGTGIPVSGDQRAVVVRELALVECPVTVPLSGRRPRTQLPPSTTDRFPSRDRLVRIATMIRDAELATPLPTARERRRRHARLIPLLSRRNAPRSLSRGRSAT